MKTYTIHDIHLTLEPVDAAAPYHECLEVRRKDGAYVGLVFIYNEDQYYHTEGTELQHGRYSSGHSNHDTLEAALRAKLALYNDVARELEEDAA